MIAYNHYIKFIPELKNDKKMKGSFSEVITVKETTCQGLYEKLVYEMKFFNNQGRELLLHTDREVMRTEKNQLWAFEVKGVVTFYWYSGKFMLEYIKHENFTETLLEYWCLHVVLPIFFTIEEVYDFFHAGAVEVGEEAILFVAQSFGGKSTMTDFFMKKGHTMISDDRVATIKKDGSIFAIPSHPHHRPYRKQEDLGFFVENYSTKPKKISTVYRLEKSDQNAEVDIHKVTGIEKFKSLRYASESNLFFLKEMRFKYIMQMADLIQVFIVKVPWSLKRLDEVYDAIIAHNNNIIRGN